MYTPRENFLHFLRGEDYEWTPTNQDQLMFRPAAIPEHVVRGSVMQQTAYPGPFGGKDLFGVEWVYEPQVRGCIETAPLFDDISDWREALVFPDVDSYGWAECAEANKEYLATDKLKTTTLYTGYYERFISFVGFENAAIAMIDDEAEDDINEIFTRLTDLYISLIVRYKKWFGVELVELHDDWGTQISTMFSPATHREKILPHLRRLTAAAREAGVLVQMHSCGCIGTLIPAMLESGVVTWLGQAVNDKRALVEQYGDRFRFGVSIWPDDKMSDDEALAYAESIISKYEGRDVWFSLAKALSPAQKKAIAALLHGRPQP